MKRVIGKIDPSDKKISIWGAGFSGLILGYYLKKNGYHVTIHEKTNKIGGKIHTRKISAGLIERGPNALYLNSDGVELLQSLKLEPLLAAKKLKRLLMINGKPKRPLQPSLFAKLGFNLSKKPPLITDGLTVAEFFRPLIGQDNIDRYLSTALSGIYATPSESLHFKSIFSEVADKAQFSSYWDFIQNFRKIRKNDTRQQELSGSVSFEGGMQTLINRLGDELKHEIKLNSKETFKLKGNNIICTDALTASELLAPFRPEFTQELKRVRYQHLSSTTVFVKKEIKPLNRAFGVLIPFTSRYHSQGILNNKAIFPLNNPNIFSYTLISRKVLNQEEVIHDLNAIYPEITTDDIEHIDTTDWERAIPVYDLPRFLSIRKLHQLSQKEANLALFGNYVAGISLREMISAAKAFAADPVNYPEVP